MQSLKQEANSGTYIFPPSPTTVRGETIVLDVNSTLDKIVYCTSNVVVLRDTADLRICETFNEHIAETTCARFAPNGTFVASGDAKGNLKIWFAKDPLHPLKKAFDNMLSGRIRDIAWTFDSQRIIVVGEGQNAFAKVVSVDTGSTLGDITGHSRTLITCAFSPARPFKLITAGEDFNVNLYEGPPFKFKHSDIKSHKNFVTSLRFNPAGETFVSVGSDKKIVIHEVATGQAKDEITDSPHVGTISACEYLDIKTLVTASMDKTVKVWNLENNTCLKKFILSDKPTVDDMQQGATLIKDGICSLSLNGTLNLWRNALSLSDDSLPSETAIGHQAPINALLYSEPLNVLVSGDRTGRVLLWKERRAIVPEGKQLGKPVAAAKISASQRGAYFASIEGVVKYLDIEKGTFTEEFQAQSFTNSLAVSKTNENLFYIATDKKKILVVENFKLKFEFSLDFEPLVIEVSNDDKTLFVGNKDGLITVIAAHSGETIVKLTQKTGVKITSLAVSWNEDKYLVSGDSSKNIFLWNLSDYSKLTEDWVYHSASVQSLEFSKDNEKVVSAGLDNTVIVWNTATHKKEAEFRHTHKGGVFRAVFLPNNILTTSGADNLIKEFPFGGN